MPDLKQSLRDFVATSNSGKYSTEEELLSKFPELQGYDIQSLKDFVATSNSGKYGTEEEVLSKFPEFGLTSEDPLKKKEQTQLPTQGNVSGTMGLPSESTSSGSLKPFDKNALLAKGLKQTTIATPLESAPQNRKETEDIANLRTPTNLTSLQAINNAAQERLKAEKEKLDLRNQIFTYQTLNPETKGGGYAALENIILDPNQSEEKKLAAQKQKETVDKYFQLSEKTKALNARIDKDETTRLKGLDERYRSYRNTTESFKSYGIKGVTGFMGMLNAIGGQEDEFNYDKFKSILKSYAIESSITLSPEEKEKLRKDNEYNDDGSLDEEVRTQKREKLAVVNKFADSLITQETPKNWQKLFEGEWSANRVGYVISQAFGQVLPTVAAGFLGGGTGAVAAGAAGAGMAYNESFDMFEKAGLTTRQSELAATALSIPLGVLEAMGVSDLVTKPAFKLLLKETTRDVISKLATKELTEASLFSYVKATMGQKIKEYGKDLVMSGVKEPLTEIEQALLSEAAGQTAEAYTGKDSNKDQTMAQYLKELGLKVSEEGFYGLVGGVGTSAVTSAVQNQANPTAYGRALELKDDALMSEFKKQLDREVKKGIITQEQAVTAVENVHKIQAADNQIPSTIEGNERRSMTATLIQIKQALKNEIEGKDKSLTGPTQAAIDDIDVKLNEIATGEDTKTEQVAPKGEGILANTETTTAALEALPLEEKTTATFKDTNGDTVSILGNEKKLSDLFHEAQSTPEDNRTEFQQSIIDTVEVSLKTPLDLETEVSRLESEFGLDKQTITEADTAISQLSDNEQVTETVTSLDDVPVEFRDRVTVNQTEGTPKRKQFFGIKYGKEIKGQTKETYTYTATGKEIKSAYAATKQRVGAAPTTDTGVSATNKSSLDTLKAKTTDAVKLKVVESAQKAIKTLQSVMPNFDIVVHEDEGSYNAAVEKTGGKQNTKGNFNAVKNADGTYSGRIDINLSRASTTTVAHEVAHGIMLQAFGDKPALFKEFRNKISTVLKQSTNDKLIEFADQYKTDVTYEEYLAELTGLLEQEQANISPTTLQRIAAIINKIVSTLSAGQVKVFEDLKNTKDVIDFFSNVSQAIKGGEAIQFLNETQAYGEGLAIKVPSDFVATKSKKLSAKSQIGDYVIPSEYVGKDEFDVLKLGEVPVKNLTDLIKQYEGRVVIITSDATGYGVDSDNEPILGGYGFANNAKNIEDGIGFASLGVGTVKGAYTAAEKAYGQGKTLVLIMIQPPHTTINNSYGAKYLMRAMQQLGALSPEKLAEAKKSIKNFINNSTSINKELKAEAEAAEAEALAIKKAKEKGEEVKKSEAGAKRRTSKTELFKLIDSIQPDSNLKELTDAYLNCTTFNTRKYIGMGVLSEHKGVQTNEKTTKSKLLFREVGATIYDFLKEYGDQSFLTEDMMLNNVGGFTVGGFELDVTSVEEREKLIEEIQTKGILHPLFNGKLPGTNHFILDGVYDVQENFSEFARPEKGIDMSTQLDKVTAKERKIWFNEFISKKDAKQKSGIGIDKDKFQKEFKKLPKKELKEEYFTDEAKQSFQNGLENIVRDKMSRKYFEKLANGNKAKLDKFYESENRSVDPSKRTYSMLSGKSKVDFKETYLAPKGLLKDVVTHVPTKVAGGIGFIPQEGAAERMAQTEFKKSEKLTQQKNDKENNAGVQSNLGKGQESKQAKSNKSASSKKISTSGDVQAYEEEVTALEQSFPINKSQVDAVKTIDRMVRDARGQGFSEEAIAIFLERNGFTAPEIEAVMAIELGASKQMVLSEETMPGFDKMMAAINKAIKKDKALTTVPNKDILSRIMKYLAKQDTYKNATDVQREKLVRDIRKTIGIREKAVKNLSTTLDKFERYESAFGIDVTLGNIVDPNNITMTEKELLIKQIKDYARGARDVKAAWVKASAELTKDIKNMMKTGKISVKQAASIVRRFSAVNVFSEKSIGKFVDYMTKVFNDAEYVNQLSIAQKTKKAIASLSRNQDRNANLRELGKNFTEIDPSMVDDIYKYNTVAAAIYEAIYGSKLTSEGPKFAQTINIESVSKYVDEMVESQNKKLLDEKIAEIQELMGVDASKFTPQEIKALLENTQTIKKSNEVAIKDSIKNMFGIYSTLIKETISRGTDLFTGEPRNFTKQQKELISRFMAMDLNNLNAKQSLAAVDSLINFFQNDSTAKMEAVLSDYAAMENTKILIDKNIKSLRLNKWFSDDFGKFLAEQTYNLPMVFERMFKGVGRGAYVQKMSGLTKLINKKSLAVSESNVITENYVNQFYKQEANGEAFNTSENNVERGIAAFMMRTFVGSEEKMQTEFDRRKKLVEQTIDVLSKGNDEEKVKGELYQKVYEKFKKAENIQDVMDATDKINLEAIQFWQNAWGDKFDKLADVSLNVYNKVLNKELNYIPDNLRKLASNSKTTDLQKTAAMNESSFHHNNNSLYDTEAGVLQTPSYPTELPTDDKNNRTNRVVDFSFDSNNANSMYDALVDVNTAAAVRQVDTFINGDDFNKIFNMEDGKMLKDRIEGYVRNIRSRNIYSQDEFSKFAKALNKVAAIGVGQALGGPTQTLKQVIPGAFNTLVNAQDLDISSSLNSDFQTWLGESGYAIGSRGVKSQADIDSLNKLIKEDAKTGGKKTLELVLKVNEWWLQTFLVSPDVYIAKASWKSYYEKSLRQQGIDTKNLDYSSHTLNEDAADYAQRMVDRQQNVSDADLNGFLFTDKEASRQILVKIFMPFANFRMNQAARLGSDINVLTSKTSTVEDRRIAALSLSGFAVEMAVFKMLSGGLVYLFGSLTKWLMDDDENKEERKKRRESIIKGQATSAVVDILSPAPILDPILQYGAAYALAQTQRMLKTKEKDVVALYEPKAKTIAEQYGLFGIPLIRAAQLGEMTMLAYNGIYEDDYGRERKISKNDQELIRNMIPLALLTNIGLAPVEVNTVMRNTIKFAKKGSKTTKSVDREKSNDYGIYDTKEDLKRYDPILYEEKFGKNSEDYIDNEEERKAKKEERDLKRAEKDAKYGYVPKIK
jgi:hypothetical protein